MKRQAATVAVQGKEAGFHDGWAAGTPVEQVMVRECFESLGAQENRFILRLIKEKMGGLEGRKVLDIGSGLGESAVYFALQGANVTATDISPRMVARCLEAARYHGVQEKVKGVVAPAEGLRLEERDYDIVFAANVFHHVTDIEGLLIRIREHLMPGGMLFSWDPVAYNPLINVYRRMAVEVRTEDERPFRRGELDSIRKVFPGMRHKEFWISTLAIFLKYYLIDKKNPNDCRYWKQVLLETDRTIGWWFRPLLALDCLLRRIPGIRWLCWNTVIWATKNP